MFDFELSSSPGWLKSQMRLEAWSALCHALDAQDTMAKAIAEVRIQNEAQTGRIEEALVAAQVQAERVADCASELATLRSDFADFAVGLDALRGRLASIEHDTQQLTTSGTERHAELSGQFAATDAKLNAAMELGASALDLSVGNKELLVDGFSDISESVGNVERNLGNVLLVFGSARDAFARVAETASERAFGLATDYNKIANGVDKLSAIATALERAQVDVLYLANAATVLSGLRDSAAQMSAAVDKLDGLFQKALSAGIAADIASTVKSATGAAVDVASVIRRPVSTAKAKGGYKV